MGLQIGYFYSLTPREFMNISTGIRLRQDNDYKNGWEKARQIMYFSLLPYKPKNGAFTPQSILKFPWEKEETLELQAEHVTDEQYQEMLRTWAVMDAKRNPKTDC